MAGYLNLFGKVNILIYKFKVLLFRIYTGYRFLNTANENIPTPNTQPGVSNILAFT